MVLLGLPQWRSKPKSSMYLVMGDHVAQATLIEDKMWLHDGKDTVDDS